MNVFINEEPYSVKNALSLEQLIEELGFANHKGIALAVNNEVIPRLFWKDKLLEQGSRILVIKAAQGG